MIRKNSLFAGVLLFVAATGAAADAAERLQVATPSGSASAVFSAIASRLGLFKEVGLDVTIFDAGGGNNAVSTVVGGDAQIGVVGIRNGSKPVERGQVLKLVATDTVVFTQYIVVRADILAGSKISPASSLAERGALLRGLKIAVNDIGGSSGEFARYALNAAGYGGRDATIINVNSSAGRLTALKGRRIDATVATPPEPETAVVGGYGAILVDPTRHLPDVGKLSSNVHIVRADYLKNNAGVVKRYLQAVERARLAIRRDPEAAKRAFYDYQRDESHSELDSKVADLAWQDLLPSFADTLVTSREQYLNAQRFFKIPARVTYEQFIDNSVAESLSAGN